MVWKVKITDQDGKTFFTREFYNEYDANKEALKWNQWKGLEAQVVLFADGKGNRYHE